MPIDNLLRSPDNKGKTMRIYAPAKINWTLEVLGHRPDGYHEIRTVLQTIEPCDQLEFLPSESLRLEAEGPHEPAEDDLILQAVRCLQTDPPGVLIRLKKRIPPAAGLGGGSSDAAATLRALASWWELDSSPQTLTEAATTLGSDVPFFLHGGTALAQGKGEGVTPLADAPTTWLVVVVPPFSLPNKTAYMYKSLAPSAYSDGSFTQGFLQRLTRDGVLDEQLIFNAFERTAYALFPDLAKYRSLLMEAGGRRVHLTGSGPALFSLARDQEEAQRIQRNLDLSEGQAFAVRTLARQEALHSEP